MKVLVTGPRGWTNARCYFSLSRVMCMVREDYGVPAGETITLIEGEARGFDRMARSIAENLGWEIDPHPVEDWYPGGVYNPEAGHTRNQEMVDLEPDIAIAGILPCEKKEHADQPPHNTHGTADCIERIEDAGIPLVEVRPDGES
jgi:hypothetical protein